MVTTIQKQQFVHDCVSLLSASEEREKLSVWVTNRLQNLKPKKELDEEAIELLKIKLLEKESVGRFKFSQSVASSGDKLINRIFEKIYSEKKDAVLRLAGDQKILEPVYYNWKKTLIIDVPKMLANVFLSTLNKVAFVVMAWAAFAFGCYSLYNWVGPFLIEKALPFLINNFPSYVFRIAGELYQIISDVYKFSGMILIIGLMVSSCLSREKFWMFWDAWMVLFSNVFQSLNFFVLRQCVSIAKAVWDISDEMGCFFRNIAIDNTDRMNKLQSEKILKVWIDIFPKQAA